MKEMNFKYFLENNIFHSYKSMCSEQKLDSKNDSRSIKNLVSNKKVNGIC